MGVSIPPLRLAPSQVTRIPRIAGGLGSFSGWSVFYFLSLCLSDQQCCLFRSVYDDNGSKMDLGTWLLLFDPCYRLERYRNTEDITEISRKHFLVYFFLFFSLGRRKDRVLRFRHRMKLPAVPPLYLPVGVIRKWNNVPCGTKDGQTEPRVALSEIFRAIAIDPRFPHETSCWERKRERARAREFYRRSPDRFNRLKWKG